MKYAYTYNSHQYCCVKSVKSIFLIFMYFCCFIIPVVINVDRPPISDKCTKYNITFMLKWHKTVKTCFLFASIKTKFHV